MYLLFGGCLLVSIPSKLLRYVMKTTFGFVIMLLSSTALWAQGGGPDACVYCNCLVDATCTPTVCNSSQASDCATRTFSVTCPGTYYLRVQLYCSNGSYCEGCCAETIITGPGVNVLCHMTCQPNVCKYDCNITLAADVTYTWYTCLRVCPNQTCDDCTEGSCVARAWLMKNLTDTCPRPCN